MIGGTFLGALVPMGWGYSYWDLILPPNTAFLDPPRQPALAEALRSYLPTAGTYFIPHDLEDHHPQADGSGRKEDAHHDEDPHTAMVKQVKGTIAMIHFAPNGGNPLAPVTWIISFVHFVLTTLMASLLLVFALPVLESYGKRAGFVFAVAAFGIIAFRFTDPAWYLLPWDYFLYVALYLITGWLAAALVIAALVRPRGK
ncbi:MAG: hypothetical protein V3S64_14365 [bacterium]